MSARIGVFVCYCGLNISSTVDVEAVAEALKGYPGVVVSTTYKYMCSDPGQKLIGEAVTDYNLDRFIVAACTPNLHLKTYRTLGANLGLNPFQVEQANIREQCSWVHQNDRAAATAKAVEVIKAVVEQIRRDEPLTPGEAAITRRVVVIGGGLAGIQAALDVADAGYAVVLVEREPYLGGHLRELSGTYLNFNAPAGLLEERIERVTHHPNIQVLTQSEVTELSGYLGNFEAKVVQHDGTQDEPYTFDAGAVIIATGYETLPLTRLPMYGGGSIPNVIDGLGFEAMLNPNGPTGGQVRRPSDGQIPRHVVWLQCAGAREPASTTEGVAYCSKVCCMTTAKQTLQYKALVPEGQATVFYMDIRSAGLGYDEVVQRAMQEQDVLYLRGKVSRLFERDGKVVIWGADTLSGLAVEVEADLVVLQTPMTPRHDAAQVAQLARLSQSADGFFAEAHVKMRPVETFTAGVFLAGTAQSPRDIPETVAQASAAASKVLGLFALPKLVLDPAIATVDPAICAGCGVCIEVCPYDARSIDPWAKVAVVNPALCQSCGACVVACPNKASRLINSRPDQVLAMVDAALESCWEGRHG
jgi:heterodisulfide reductase subunit A